jgi:hypothetical protein
MPDVVRALAISGGILLLVVVLTIIVSIITVNRGAAEMAGGHEGHAPEPLAEAKLAVAAKGGKAAAAAVEEINVLWILGLGTALFVLAVLGMFALSLIEHM